MIKGREYLRRPLEPGEPIRVVSEGVRENLQRDLAVELRVGGLPDLAHAPLAEEGRDVVVAEAGAGTEGHDLSGSKSGHSTPRRPTAPPAGTEMHLDGAPYAWLLRSAPSVSTAAASSLRHGAGERVPAVGRQAIRAEAEDGCGDVDDGEDAEDEQRRHAEADRVGPRPRGSASRGGPAGDDGG